jgi:hypothetical protein
VRLGEHLVDAGVIDAMQLRSALQRAELTGERVGAALVALGYATADQIAVALAAQHRIQPAREKQLANASVTLAKALPADLARRLRAVAVSEGRDRELVVALADPSDADAIAAIEKATSRVVVAVAASTARLEPAIGRLYPLAPADDIAGAAAAAASALGPRSRTPTGPTAPSMPGRIPMPALAPAVRAPSPPMHEALAAIDAASSPLGPPLAPLAPLPEPKMGDLSLDLAPLGSGEITPLGSRELAIASEELELGPVKEPPLPAPRPASATSPGARAKRPAMAGEAISTPTPGPGSGPMPRLGRVPEASSVRSGTGPQPRPGRTTGSSAAMRGLGTGTAPGVGRTTGSTGSIPAQRTTSGAMPRTQTLPGGGTSVRTSPYRGRTRMLVLKAAVALVVAGVAGGLVYTRCARDASWAVSSSYQSTFLQANLPLPGIAWRSHGSLRIDERRGDTWGRLEGFYRGGTAEDPEEAVLVVRMHAPGMFPQEVDMNAFRSQLDRVSRDVLASAHDLQVTELHCALEPRVRTEPAGKCLGSGLFHDDAMDLYVFYWEDTVDDVMAVIYISKGHLDSELAALESFIGEIVVQ